MDEKQFDFQSENTLIPNEVSITKKLPKYIKNISTMTFPIMFFFLCLFLQQTINLIFIGKTFDPANKEKIIEGIGITHLYLNVTLLSVFVGLLSGLESLGSHAYGVKNFKLLGLYYHRAIIVAFTFTIPMVIIHYFTAIRVLGLFSVGPEILEHINSYLHTLVFFAIPDVFFSANFRYINIISKSYVNLIILFTTICLHPLWCYILIIVLDMGLKGAGLSIVISQTLNAIAGCFYIWYIKPNPESVFFPTRDSFKSIGSYLKVALPTTFLICAEWWAFEIQAIIAKWISDDDYTAHILVSAISMNIFTISLGFSSTSVVFVGKLISNSTISKTKRYIKTIFIFGISVLLAVLSLVFIFRNQVIYIFMKEGEIDVVVEKATMVIYLIILESIFDYTQIHLAHILRGLGKQLFASVVAFINFYIIQTGFAILFGKYLEMGVFGIWIGISIGCLFGSILYFIILIRLDLKKIQSDVLKKLEEDKQDLNVNDEISTDDENGLAPIFK
jgi:MATE family multidrug resistance protein